MVGVPLVKQVLDVGLAMIMACEVSKHRIFDIIVPADNNNVVPKTLNEVQGKVVELKNRVAEYLLVIAKFAKNMEDSLTKTSNDVMDEIKELKEYVREIASPLVLLMSTFITVEGVLH